MCLKEMNDNDGLVLNDLLSPYYKLDQTSQKAEVTVGSALETLNNLEQGISTLYKEENDYGFWQTSFKREF